MPINFAGAPFPPDALRGLPFAPITTDTIVPFTEQFYDIIDNFTDVFVINAVGSPNLFWSPVFGELWSTGTIRNPFFGQDAFTHNGIGLIRGPTSAGLASFMGFNKPTRINTTLVNSEFTTRVFIASANFIGSGYFGIGSIPKGGTGPPDASFVGGLFYNPTVNPTNLLVGTITTAGNSSPFLFRNFTTGLSGMLSAVDTGINIASICERWVNIRYTTSFNSVTVDITREGASLLSLNVPLTSASIDQTRSGNLRTTGASSEIGVTLGTVTYPGSRWQIFFDYFRYRVTDNRGAPSNWNSLRF